MPFRALSSPEGDDPLPSALWAATFPKGEGFFAAAQPSFAPALRYCGPRVSARIRCFGADTPGGVSLRGKRETITTQPRLAAPRMGFAAVVTWVQRWEQAPTLRSGRGYYRRAVRDPPGFSAEGDGGCGRRNASPTGVGVHSAVFKMQNARLWCPCGTA